MSTSPALAFVLSSTLTLSFWIEEAAHGIEALKKIRSFKPYVVFLDIEMPEASGLDVLMNCEERNFRVIFARAHPEFALRAFEEEASNYLLRPYRDEHFYKALDRALHELQQPSTFTKLDEHLRTERLYFERLTIRTGSRIHILPILDVLSFHVQQQELPGR